MKRHRWSDRPYDGQAHTFTGERGRAKLPAHMTLRDLGDVLVEAIVEHRSLHDRYGGAPGGDPDAIAQMVLCKLEEEAKVAFRDAETTRHELRETQVALSRVRAELAAARETIAEREAAYSTLVEESDRARAVRNDALMDIALALDPEDKRWGPHESPSAVAIEARAQIVYDEWKCSEAGHDRILAALGLPLASDLIYQGMGSASTNAAVNRIEELRGVLRLAVEVCEASRRRSGEVAVALRIEELDRVVRGMHMTRKAGT